MKDLEMKGSPKRYEWLCSYGIPKKYELQWPSCQTLLQGQAYCWHFTPGFLNKYRNLLILSMRWTDIPLKFLSITKVASIVMAGSYFNLKKLAVLGGRIEVLKFAPLATHPFTVGWTWIPTFLTPHSSIKTTSLAMVYSFK